MLMFVTQFLGIGAIYSRVKEKEKGEPSQAEQS